MRTAVVIPVGPGRTENLMAACEALAQQTRLPDALVIVHDGPESHEGDVTGMPLPTIGVVLPKKHEPGMEQPRNEGVRVVQRHFPDVDHAWFLDSDIVVEPDCYQAFVDGHHAVSDVHSWAGMEPWDRILIGPYDWLFPGQRPEGMPLEEFCRSVEAIRHQSAGNPGSDFRWDMLNEHGPEVVHRGSLGVALGCFSGNLVWPIADFVRVGGFWSEIHHGRCEDGELGLRAASLGIPMSLVREARGYHLSHPVNHALQMQWNARDVPMLNDRHPWVEQEGIVLTADDGARFDITCGKCGEQVNTILMWDHESTHRGGA